MSIMTRRPSSCRWSFGVGLFACACAAEDGDGDGDEGTLGADESTTVVGGTLPTSATAGAEASGTDTGVSEVESTDPTAVDDSSSGEIGDEGSSSDGDGGSSETGAIEYDAEFLWVADFLRTNCAQCHATNMNGNLVLPSPDIDNEQVRLALEGVVATTGLLLVEPGDHLTSQTWLQITNEFGAVFPVQDTDRFGAWIDAGAPYYAE
jgi:hypothetical protein